MGNTVGASGTELREGSTLPQPFPATEFGIAPVIITLSDPAKKTVQFPVAPEEVDADLAAVAYDGTTSQIGTIADSLGTNADTITMTAWLPGPSAQGTEWAPDGVWRPPLEILNDLKAWLRKTPITPVLNLSAPGLDLPPQVKLMRLRRVYKWPDADGVTIDLTLREWIGLQLFTTDERPPIVQNPERPIGSGNPAAVPGAGPTGGISPTNPNPPPPSPGLIQPLYSVNYTDIIRPGDTLQSISMRNYGTDAYAWDIYYNNLPSSSGSARGVGTINDPTNLVPGTIIQLPQGGTTIPNLAPPTNRLPHAGV